MNVNEARDLLDKWKRGWVVMNDLSTQIMTEEIWLTLGYQSFTEMFEAEGLNNLTLSAPARRSAIRAMMEELPGISNRKVAEILGVNEKTVRNDITADRSAPILPQIKPLRLIPKPKSNTILTSKAIEPTTVETVDAEIVEDTVTKVICPHCGGLVS